jgi:hypothetical protein
MPLHHFVKGIAIFIVIFFITDKKFYFSGQAGREKTDNIQINIIFRRERIFLQTLYLSAGINSSFRMMPNSIVRIFGNILNPAGKLDL